jgi:starvation-inducible outer membrane lipoprotein
MKHALLLAAALALSGCAFVYDQVQDHAQARCANLGNAQEQRACEKRNAPAYDDYEARRLRLQEGNKPS